MTEQELFDTVAKHLLTQNKRSIFRTLDGRDMCRYRAPNGLKCAIGCLIPDEKYLDCFENLRATHPIIIAAANLQGVEGLADDLQCLHDKSPLDTWPDQLHALAKAHNLDPKVVDECKN